MSRSAAVLMGYLIRRQRWTYERAYMHTKLIRGVVSPNAGFETVLQDYERQHAATPMDGGGEAAGGGAGREQVASPEVPRGEREPLPPPALLQQPQTPAGDLSDVSLSTPAAREEDGAELVRTYTPEQQERLEIDALGVGPNFTREEILEIELPQVRVVACDLPLAACCVLLATCDLLNVLAACQCVPIVRP